jgi:phospholipase C
MPVDLSPIKTIVIVMMENRSFDHMLGYLSLPPSSRTDVNGLSNDPAWLAQYANYDEGEQVPLFLSQDPYDMPDKFDPPHERVNIAGHLGHLQNGVYAMDGFVSAIPATVSDDPAVRRLVMAYFGAAQVPMNDFFVKNFTTCDQWHCSLPAGTQPNRLMSMSGFSMIEKNQTPLPEQFLVYDWLNKQNVSWRVYHQGIPFFTMMPKWIPEILGNDHFRSFEDFESDILNTPPDQLPQMIFVEPTYGDAPHIGRSTDDHAPAGVSDGQEFLMQVYQAVISPSFWESMVLIVDYDEHGGFFDHVSPPLISTDPPPGANYPSFVSLGVRIPAYIISPFVKQGVINNTLLDHTSVLKFIGEKFGTNGSYSALVDARPVQSVSATLDFGNPDFNPPSPPALNTYLAQRPPAPVGATVPTPINPLQQAFRQAIDGMRQNGAGPDHPKFGELLRQVPPSPIALNAGVA